MTWPPAASIRAAAAITSITMNGGTSLRPEAVSSPFARSLNVASSIDFCYFGRCPSPCPRLAAFGGLLGHISYPIRRQRLKTLHAATYRAGPENAEPDRARRSGRDRCFAGRGAGAGEGPVGAARRRDRAIAARLHAADPAGGGPGKAEHPGGDHQRQRF